jgi:beta-galactosidase
MAAATLAVAPFAVYPATAQATPAAEFRFGVSWYPEQWPRERWETDLQLMQRAGFNTVRMAEFSWSTLEPEEGKYDFAWLDDAIAMAAKHGMKVVLGTPTAAPPAWLTQKYPDVLRVDEAGVAAGHGGRRHFSFASAKYRAFARDIATRMADRYGHNPAVIGWQIDNEVGPPSFDPESVAAWHAFLKKKYGTIDTLNERWTTEYWSQHYNSFDQVPLHATGQQNPGLLLDFKHFCTDTWKSYIDNQADAIRATVDKRQFITTNTMFWNAGFDHFEMHRNLDIAAWDNYITDGKPDWVANGANHDLVRGYKQKNFWLMETQPDRVDWVPVNVTLAPGQIREMAWQAVGHGADAVLYWQWRPARTGQEQYHGTLLGQDGTPVPAFAEVAATGTELAKAANALNGTTPVAKVAFLWSYDSRWSIDLQPHNKDYNPVKAFTAVYRPFRVQAQSVDVISVDADLSKYPIVVAPDLNVLTQAQADRLTAYVKGGGHLIIGPRTGMKTEDNALWTQRQPGPLAATLGGRVEQYFALDKPVGVAGSLGTGTSSLWAEWLNPQAKDVKVLETYTDPGGWLDGKAAVIRRAVGKGDITYIGGWFDDATFARIATEALQGAGIKPILSNVDADIEVSERDGPTGKVLILINHGAAAHPVTLPAGAKLLEGQWQDGQIAAHGVAVFTLAN